MAINKSKTGSHQAVGKHVKQSTNRGVTIRPLAVNPSAVCVTSWPINMEISHSHSETSKSELPQP